MYWNWNKKTQVIQKLFTTNNNNTKPITKFINLKKNKANSKY